VEEVQQRNKLTVQARLMIKGDDEGKMLDELMRKWSSCMRFAYNRLLEGKERKGLKRELQELFNLNSRYVDSAIKEAEWTLISAKKRGMKPEKVIFGGKALFEKLKSRHLSDKERQKLRQEWRDKRQGNLYSIGEGAKKGNLNLRVIKKEEDYYLRINVGERKWIYLKLITSHKKWPLFESCLNQGTPYSVRVIRRDGKYYCFMTFDEPLPEIVIGFEKGAIGVDLNVGHVSWAETREDGNLTEVGDIQIPKLCDGRKEKRDYYAWIYAHKIIEIALEKGKGIVLEYLKIKNKGQRGDYSGRKSRRKRHNFSYRKLKERIIILAKRYGVTIKQVNPAYTSVIGMLKYAPQKNLSRDTAGAWVIARRGLGLGEKVPKNYRVLLQSSQCEPGTVPLSTDGRNKGSAENLQRSLYNPWQVLRVAVLTALFPEKQYSRCFSPLKSLLVSGDLGRTPQGREVLLPGVGPMDAQIPGAGSEHPELPRTTNSLA